MNRDTTRTFFLIAAASICLLLALDIGWAQTEGEAPAAAATQTTATGGEVEAPSVMQMLINGGPVMIPLALFSIIMLTLGFERFFSLSRNNVVPMEFPDDLKNILKNPQKPELVKAIEYCEEQGHALAHVFAAGLGRWQEGQPSMESAMTTAATREVGRMKRSLRGLRIIAAISPLLGLLGTVLGMIRAFQTVATTSGSLGRPEMLAQGIYEAMVTTAAGLTIAVPSLLIYYYLAYRVDGYADDIEIAGDEFLDNYVKQKLQTKTTGASS